MELPEKKVTIEIRSLNSKTLDLNTRIPSFYREKELEIRNLISEKVQRGKVDFSMMVELNPAARNQKVNADLIKSYIAEFKNITPTVTDGELLPVVMRLPDVISYTQDDLGEDEWNQIRATIITAIDALNEFRLDEGKVLEKYITSNLTNILDLLTQVVPFEIERITTIKERFAKRLEEVKVEIDQNRFEQELIFYLEKYDITEERVRLGNHLNYFLETLNGTEANGRKLGFITQEMGREINTMGSKSNHTEMQKLVVMMKDELEKIKEQVLNVL